MISKIQIEIEETFLMKLVRHCVSLQNRDPRFYRKDAGSLNKEQLFVKAKYTIRTYGKIYKIATNSLYSYTKFVYFSNSTSVFLPDIIVNHC